MIPGRSELVLVEDNEGDEALTLRALRKNGILDTVVVVRDGVEALDYLLARNAFVGSPLPRVVLLDLNLPKISGFEVLRLVRASERTRTVPVVVLSSSQEEKDLERAYALGANSYVVKPVDFKQFSEMVRQVGDYWLNVNQRAPAPAQETP